jgi:hypothetical protein
VALAAAPATASVQARVPTSTSDHIALFAADWKSPTRTSAAWDAAARRFDVLIGQREQYAARLDHLRSLNPRLVILAYNNGPYLVKDSPQYNNTMATHPEYFARDAGGNLIYATLFPGNVLMDQGVAGYRDQAASAIADLMQNHAFDGVDVDSMGKGAVDLNYVSAIPYNASAGHAYTAGEWLSTSVLTLNAIKDAVTARVGPRYVLFNGLVNGPNYNAGANVLSTSKADGGMAESFIRLSGQRATLYPSVTDWLANLNMMKDMQAKGKGIFAWTKVWTTATAAQKTAWNNFALATYLLGKEGSAYYNFLPDNTSDKTKVFYPNWTAKLGSALGPYTVSGGVYSRTFQHGKVSVNPTTHAASITVTP